MAPCLLASDAAQRLVGVFALGPMRPRGCDGRDHDDDHGLDPVQVTDLDVPAIVPALIVVPNLHVLEHAAGYPIGVECGHDSCAPITDGRYHVGITDE